MGNRFSYPCRGITQLGAAESSRCYVANTSVIIRIADILAQSKNTRNCGTISESFPQ